jgi:radical SAM superfamily enzyme YgiQ (UPF0313 family)
MKVMFISLPKYIASGHNLKPLFRTPPTTHLWLAALLLREGHSVVILDGIARNMSLEQILDEIEREKPDAVGFTVFTSGYPDVVQVASQVKLRFPGVLVLAGGYHVNSVPEDFERECFDFSFIGEAERTLVEVLRRLESHETNFKDVPGLVHFDKDGQKWSRTPAAPFILDFDDHPILPYEMVLDNGYDPWWVAANPSKNKFMATITGKGCPMECSFCDISKTEGMRYRCMGAERVLQELEYMHFRLGITHVEFRDPFFTINTGRVKDIAQGIIDRGIKIEWGFSTTLRKLKDPEFLALLKRAGCRFIFIGIESGNPEILMREKKVTKQQARDVMAMVKRSGLQTHCSFIFGLEGDTEETIQQTIDFSLDLSPTTASFCLAMPYPGTALFNSYMEKGYIKTTDWSKYDGGEGIFETPDLTPALIEKYLKIAHSKFYGRPSYIFQKLMTVRSFHEFFFMAKVAINILVDFRSYKR